MKKKEKKIFSNRSRKCIFVQNSVTFLFIIRFERFWYSKNVIAYQMKTVHEKRFSQSTFYMYIGHSLHIWYHVAF